MLWSVSSTVSFRVHSTPSPSSIALDSTLSVPESFREIVVSPNVNTLEARACCLVPMDITTPLLARARRARRRQIVQSTANPHPPIRVLSVETCSVPDVFKAVPTASPEPLIALVKKEALEQIVANTR